MKTEVSRPKSSSIPRRLHRAPASLAFLAAAALAVACSNLISGDDLKA